MWKRLMTCGTFFVWGICQTISEMEPATKKQRLEGLAQMKPSYTPLEQYLFLEVGALNTRMSNMEQERSELLEKLTVLENVVWKMLRNQGGYVTEVTEAVLEQTEPDDETGTISEILAQWNAEQDQAQEEWLELFDQWFEETDVIV